MNKNELISQLTSLVEDYTEGLRSANNKLFHSGQRLTAEKQEWEQKYHSAMAANKRLNEQNEGLMVEKQALLDVVADWKSENQSLAALNEILSGELATLKKEDEQLTQACKNWQENYFLARRELAEKETALSKAFAAAEETYEDSKKRSDGILATMGENLQRKQKQIEALTTWKEGTEKVLDYIEARAKEKQEKIDSLIGNNEILARTAYNFQAQLESLKQINSFQEHRIEVLSRKARKKAKEQND